MDEYDIQNTDDIQEALKDLLGGTIKSMMESEMTEHLRYEKSERSDSDNYRNGTKKKTLCLKTLKNGRQDLLMQFILFFTLMPFTFQ